jgi:hypothetical protein
MSEAPVIDMTRIVLISPVTHSDRVSPSEDDYKESQMTKERVLRLQLLVALKPVSAIEHAGTNRLDQRSFTMRAPSAVETQSM